MRVNIYAEEMTERVEIISKVVEGHTFTGLRLYLELPASYVRDGSCPMGHPATVHDTAQADHYQAPFIHRPGDDDSSAVTFWGKRDLRDVLKIMLAKLDEHYAPSVE
jgi:hypothetical protein